MNDTVAVGVITTAITDYGMSVLAIVGVVLGVGVGYLVFRMGWRAIKNIVMGSHGMAFNLHGEAKGNREFYADGRKINWKKERYTSDTLDVLGGSRLGTGFKQRQAFLNMSNKQQQKYRDSVPF